MENEIAKVCVWREARGEVVDGQYAVAHVIRNRTIKQGKTPYEIVTAALQFSSMTFKADPQLGSYPSLSDVKFQNICLVVDDVFQLRHEDNTGGATFYENPTTANSVWFSGAIRDGKLVKTVMIGNHIFYKEV